MVQFLGDNKNTALRSWGISQSLQTGVHLVVRIPVISSFTENLTVGGQMSNAGSGQLISFLITSDVRMFWHLHPE